jgi:outer membrane murein-binding lipoprotein Lpp
VTQSEVVQIDKRFIAVIVTLLIQSGVGVWWASAITSDVAALRAADTQIVSDATARETRLRLVEQGAGRTEAKLEAIAEGIDRLNSQIDRLIETQP